ncbi:hypothetical protein A5699_07080 [Mycobacterium sp. E802]|uniref:type VII secretion target n=1 Tax=Mycobacterium sp. E802 TaxID=1834152 RepID=UPI0007FD5758|nr:hypothetical protein A5699_07080 [Mycobacterium sp. E802]
MANELHVDAAGLRTASASSDNVAAGLGSGSFEVAASSRPSGAGVAAVNAALTAMRNRQSERMAGQADALSVSSTRYDITDSDGHDAITTVSV